MSSGKAMEKYGAELERVVVETRTHDGGGDGETSLSMSLIFVDRGFPERIHCFCERVELDGKQSEQRNTNQ